MRNKLMVTIFCIALSGAAFSQTNRKNYLEMLDKCLYIESANLRMEVFKNSKTVQYYEMVSFRKGEKMRLEFLNPATERGRKMLNDNSNLWMYLPRTSKIMKIPLKQSFMGSDASNRDLMRMAFQQDYEIVKVNNKGNKLISLELKAKDLTISYNKVILTIDTEKMIPVKQEMYSLSDKLVKTIVYEDPIMQDGLFIPTKYTIQDNLQQSTSTILTYKNMRRQNDKQSAFFTLGALKN